MTTKPDAKVWSVKEQTIEDPTTGLTIQFEVSPSGEPRLRLLGDHIPFGNREIQFSKDGEEVGAGAAINGLLMPARLLKIDDDDED